MMRTVTRQGSDRSIWDHFKLVSIALRWWQNSARDPEDDVLNPIVAYTYAAYTYAAFLESETIVKRMRKNERI